MKALIQYSCLGLALLVAGCAAEETDTLMVAPASTSVEVVVTAVDVTLMPPSSPSQAVATSAATVSAGVVPVETDAERRTELADYTEKVYLRWNAALTDYRRKQSRWPGSLHELQQHQPELVSLQPPRGFTLKLDPQAGEIYLTRASQPRSSVTVPPPVGIP